MKTEIEKISFGPTFEGVFSFFGLVLIPIGVAMFFVFETMFFAPLILIIGLIIFLQIKEVLINYSTKQIKSYVSILIYKTGRWESLEKYKWIGLDSINETKTFNSRGGSNTVKIKYYDVFLFDEYKKNKLLLKTFDRRLEAEKFSHEFSLKLNIQKVELPRIKPHERDLKRKYN